MTGILSIFQDLSPISFLYQVLIGSKTNVKESDVQLLAQICQSFLAVSSIWIAGFLVVWTY